MTAPRALPSNIELEQALLGALLLDNVSYRKVSDLLRPEHFFDPLHRRLYEIAVDLIESGKVATPLTIGPHLPADADKIKVDGRHLTVKKYIAKLSAEATMPGVRDYAEAIANLARRREIIRVTEEIAAAAYDGADGDLAAKARTVFGEIAKARGQGDIKFKLVPFGDMKSDPAARAYLIKGVLPRQGLVVVWGPPKCGKSFWVFDAVMHVAIGRDYRGHRVRLGDVVYLALEGQAGFGDRKEAFCRRFIDPDEPATAPLFHLCGAGLDLIHDHEKLIADIGDQSVIPVVVVIDTLNRSLAGSENKDEDMTAYVRAADAVQREFGCTVVIIHHCGVNGERPRGHTSLTGAADVQISVRKSDGGTVTTTIELAKDMAEGATFASRLEVVEVGTDPDGDRVTSCVMMPVEDAPASIKETKPTREPDTHRIFRAAFDAAIANGGEPITVKYGEMPISAVALSSVREQFEQRYATGESDKRKRADKQRKAFIRALGSLASEGGDYRTCYQQEREWIWQSPP
jgi:AAA domain/DnaB-like helicase N terminal domain